MSGRFVRASKYRHVFGRPTKREQCYDNLHISRNAWDTNLIKANPTYLSVNWEASGGGALAVIPLEERGKLPDQLPLFRGHTAPVLDTDWSPFDDSLLASGSDDGKVFIWRVPEGFTLHTDADEPTDVQPVDKLTGHTRKVGHVLFNPSAANVLASSSGDYTIKLWDVTAKSAQLALKHPDIVQSLSWSGDGGMMVTTCRDKKLRFWDVRQEKPAHEVPGHSGAKNSRAVWMGEHDRVATTGFSRMSDRQLGLHDLRNPKEPVGGFQTLDSISGVCMPFWDDGTQMLYLAGKGDGNIRYYEYENDKFEYLSEHKSADPQRGIAFVPKRGVNLHENEIMRAYKTVNDSHIEPVSFVVPRRAEVFQSDIYPPTTGTKASMSSDDYFSGKATSLPPKIDLEGIYEGTEPQEIPAAQAPKPAQAKATPAPAVSAPSAASKPEPAAVPVATSRGPSSSSMTDNKASMSALASKFADNDDDAAAPSSDGANAFDEIPKPIERPAAAIAARQEQKTGVSTPPMHTQAEPTKTTSSRPPPESDEPAASAASQELARSVSDGDGATDATTTTTTTTTGGAKSAAAGIKGVLDDLRAMMAKQGEQIDGLTREVAALKARVGDV